MKGETSKEEQMSSTTAGTGCEHQHRWCLPQYPCKGSGKRLLHGRLMGQAHQEETTSSITERTVKQQHQIFSVLGINIPKDSDSDKKIGEVTQFFFGFCRVKGRCEGAPPSTKHQKLIIFMFSEMRTESRTENIKRRTHVKREQ